VLKMTKERFPVCVCVCVCACACVCVCVCVWVWVWVWVWVSVRVRERLRVRLRVCVCMCKCVCVCVCVCVCLCGVADLRVLQQRVQQQERRDNGERDLHHSQPAHACRQRRLGQQQPLFAAEVSARASRKVSLSLSLSLISHINLSGSDAASRWPRTAHARRKPSKHSV
jgi:hypothetical protein